MNIYGDDTGDAGDVIAQTASEAYFKNGLKTTCHIRLNNGFLASGSAAVGDPADPVCPIGQAAARLAAIEQGKKLVGLPARV